MTPTHSRYANGHIRAWLAERVVTPWPWGTGYTEGNVKASHLYAAYSAQLEAEGHPGMTLTAFGLAIAEVGYESKREGGGYIYPQLSTQTRQGRAERIVASRLVEPYFNELVRAEHDAHMARVSHVKVVQQKVYAGRYNDAYTSEAEVPVPCDHKLPDEVLGVIHDKVEERKRELHVTGVVKDEVEREFGPYLNGHPAPDAEWAARRAVEQLDVIIPELDELKAKRPVLIERIVKAREEFLQRFPTDERRVNGTFIDSGMEKLNAAWHDGERELYRLDEAIERVTSEAEAEQHNLTAALRILDSVSTVSGELVKPEPVTDDGAAQPVW